MSSLSATKLDLSQPDKFQMASVVTKNSRLGITSNKRLLVIKKGYLYYYSNVPKKFKGDSSVIQTIHQLPKCSIEIVNIKQIKGYESNSSYFSIQFDQKNMLEREDIRKTMTLEEYNFSPKNSKQSIVWQFTCDNQFIKQRWVAALEGLRDYYNKQKKDIQKFFSEHKDNNMEMKSSSSGGRNSQVPWRESQSGNNSYKRNNDVNYLQLVATKSNDEKSKENSLSPDNKFARQNLLNVPAAGSNSPSRVRGNSSNEKKSITEFSKQYSPNEPVNKDYGMGSTISVSSSQQDLNSSSSINPINNNNNIQNSPINNLELSDVSPNKENTQGTNMIFSKTQKVKIQTQMIEQDDNQSVRTPGPSPVKGLEDGEGLDREGEQFEKSLLVLEGKNTKSQPIVQLNFQNNLKDHTQNQNNYGNEMFHEINQINNQTPSWVQKNDNLNSIIHINIENQPKSNNQTKQSLRQQITTQPPKLQLNPIQLSHSKQQNDLSIIQSSSFYALHSYLFESRLSFQQRIYTQQLFHKKIHEFSSQSVEYLKQYVESLSSSSINQSSSNNQHHFKILSKTNSHTIIKPTNSNTIFKLALVTSQSLLINGEEKIFLDEEAVKNVKRQFKVYQDVEKFIVLGGVKGDCAFRLRVPLMVLVEYKGVVALAVDQGFRDGGGEEDMVMGKGSILTNEMAKYYNKQIEVLKNQGYQPKDFSFTTYQQSQTSTYLLLHLLPQVISNKPTKQQHKKSYLKKLIHIKRPQKHHNLQFIPPFTHQLIKKAHINHASTSLQSLEQYIFTLNRVQEWKGICPKEEIIDVLKMCVFCKQLRKVYRSAQGEIEETHFLNLILNQDQDMMKMLQQSGCDQIPPLKGVLFNFIQHYLGIKSSVNQKALKDHMEHKNKQPTSLRSNNNKHKKADIVQSTQIHAIVQTYDISRIQLVEAHDSMRKFISEQKAHLALETLKILQNLHLQQYPHLNQKQLQLTSFQASLAYLQHDYLKSIQHSKRYQKLINNPHDPKLFQIYLLMLKSYSHFSQQEFSHIFDKLIKLIEFNYGLRDSVFISVYSICAFFFYDIAQKYQHNMVKANPLYLLSYKLLDQAEKLCRELFGQTSAQYVDVLMDSARLYQTKDRNKSQKYLDRARTIIISTQNNQKLADFFLYELKLKLSLKQYDQCYKLLNQCEELMHNGKFKLDQQKTIAVMKIKFDLGLLGSDKLYLSEQAVEYLWRSQKTEEKRQALVLAAKLVKKLKLIKEIIDTNGFESSQTYRHSSISSQIYDNLTQYRDTVVNKVLDIFSQSQYRIGYQTEESLMAKIKQILQDEGEYFNSTNGDRLSILLEKIA